VTLIYLAVQEPSGWIPIGISLLALVGTLGNYLLTLSRGRKHVRLRSFLDVEIDNRGNLSGREVYRCTVTNTGYIGVQVDSVELRESVDSPLGIMLGLRQDEKPRKLDQGESQEWGMYLHDIEERLQGETKVIAVAVDTTGKEYVQQRKDAVSIRSAG
jgi:hypothetical protein